MESLIEVAEWCDCRTQWGSDVNYFRMIRQSFIHLSARFRPVGSSAFGWRSTAEHVSAGLDLTGKTYLVTGANSGIGFEAVKALMKRGADVFAACRTLDKAQALRSQLGDQILPLECELGDLNSVRTAVAEIIESGRKLDGIIANAAIMALPERETLHGVEKQFFVNHVGHFALVIGLLPTLAEDGRVVVVSSSGHRMAPDAGIEFDRLDGEGWYTPWVAYGHSKLANLLFAKELARRFAGTDRMAIAVHPGLVFTNIQRNMRIAPIATLVMALGRLLVVKSAAQGTATLVYAAVHPDAKPLSGEYLEDCAPSVPTELARDPKLAARLWEATENLATKIE